MMYDLANLPYWILLGIGIALFLFVIISGGGDDDLDLDADADLGADDSLLDLDADTEVDGEVEGEWGLAQVLGWLGVGKIPLLLLLATDFSFWGFTGWMLNAAVGRWTGTIPTAFLGLGGVIFIASLCFSLYVGSLISRPIGKLFAPFGQDSSGDRLVGCLGTVTSKTVPLATEGMVGRADVVDGDRNLVTISVTLPHWASVVPHRGQQVLIVERGQHSYLAIAKDTSDEDKWMNNKH